MPTLPHATDKHLSTLNLLAYLILVIANVIALQVPFFGKTPGDVSDLYPNLLTPADFTFKIWSVIYIALGIFALYQAKSVFQKNVELDAEIHTLKWWFVLSCGLNIGWLFLWESLRIVPSFVLILALWGLLIYINYLLTMLDTSKRWYTVPFSIYLGWICVTALANMNVMLHYLEFDFFGLSQEFWTAILIGIGILGTLLVLYLNGDIVFTAVLIWAYLGMYWKNKQITPEGNIVTRTALFAMLFLGLVGILVYRRKVLIFKTAPPPE